MKSLFVICTINTHKHNNEKEKEREKKGGEREEHDLEMIGWAVTGEIEKENIGRSKKIIEEKEKEDI